MLSSPGPMAVPLTDRDIRHRRRQILTAIGLALAALLVLHNPSSGYETSTIHYEPWPMPAISGSNSYPCDPPTEQDRAAAASQEKFLGQSQGYCRNEPLDFLHWHSRGALLTYVETMRKLLAIGGGILFVGLASIWIIGDPKLRQSTNTP
jgi:hypothetical protein